MKLYTHTTRDGHQLVFDNRERWIIVHADDESIIVTTSKEKVGCKKPWPLTRGMHAVLEYPSDALVSSLRRFWGFKPDIERAATLFELFQVCKEMQDTCENHPGFGPGLMEGVDLRALPVFGDPRPVLPGLGKDVFSWDEYRVMVGANWPEEIISRKAYDVRRASRTTRLRQVQQHIRVLEGQLAHLKAQIEVME